MLNPKLASRGSDKKEKIFAAEIRRVSGMSRSETF